METESQRDLEISYAQMSTLYEEIPSTARIKPARCWVWWHAPVSFRVNLGYISKTLTQKKKKKNAVTLNLGLWDIQVLLKLRACVVSE